MKNQMTRMALALGATGALAAVVGANGAALKRIVVQDVPLPAAATPPVQAAPVAAPQSSAPGVIFLKPGAKQSDLITLNNHGHRGLVGRNFRRSADPRNGYVIDVAPFSQPFESATKTASGGLKVQCIDGDDHAAPTAVVRARAASARTVQNHKPAAKRVATTAAKVASKR